jgi:hypothetical protein
MVYSTPPDGRRFAPVDESVISDTEISEYIADADAQIDQEIGSFTEPVPRRIKRLSALLAAKDILSRPDVAVSFSAGDFSEAQRKEELIAILDKEIEKIYRHYQTGLRKV